MNGCRRQIQFGNLNVKHQRCNSDTYDAYFPVGSIWRSRTIKNYQIIMSMYQKNILMGAVYMFSG